MTIFLTSNVPSEGVNAMEKHVPEKGVPSTSAKPSKIYPTSRLIAIGASTGGPIALKTIIQGLQKNFPFQC